MPTQAYSTATRCSANCSQYHRLHSHLGRLCARTSRPPMYPQDRDKICPRRSAAKRTRACIADGPMRHHAARVLGPRPQTAAAMQQSRKSSLLPGAQFCYNQRRGAHSRKCRSGLDSMSKMPCRDSQIIAGVTPMTENVRRRTA